MVSHFECLGFDIKNKYELSDLFRETVKNSEPLYTPSGGYLPWELGNGIELWAQIGKKGNPVSLNPHFFGNTTQIIAITSKLPNPLNPLDGAFEAWVNPDIDQTEQPPSVFGDYPIIFDSPVFDWYQHMQMPVVVRAQLSAFAYQIEILDDGISNDVDGPPWAQEFFFPTGTFPKDDGSREALASFGGKVLSCKNRYNVKSKNTFTLATVRTYGMDIDVVIAQRLLTRPLAADQIIRGHFWISGKIQEILETFDTTDPIDRDRLFLQASLSGTKDNDEVAEIAKTLTFGQPVFLVREPENKRDRSTIAVYARDRIKLGYISKIDNYAMSKILDHGVRMPAHLIEKLSEPYTLLVIRIYLPPQKPAEK